ncbi:unnamed protein product, partial [Mesorhabditis belari]|uniref:Abnormal cell migration protein 18-like fibronectin type I domain-containing protein n=1 Tax=Mesorhabditis belari TaxID=2138241 RepID=A0AAF3F4K5_9BILA
MLSALATALLFSTAVAQWDMASRSRCWTSGNGRPAQWWNDGERVDRGKYWYTCKRGELWPEGCFTNDNKRINLWGTFIENGYEITCSIDDQNYLVFKTSACLDVDGRRYRLYEQWTDPSGTYYWECKPDGPYLKAEVIGCMTHDHSRRIALGESYDEGDYRYECQRKFNGSVSMCSIGCVHRGQHFKVGEQFVDGEYVYYCKSNKGRCQKVCVGCLWKEKRLYDGDRYRENGTVFQCEIRPDSFGRKAVGCHVPDSDGSMMDRVIGCRWYLKTKDSKIEQTCVMDGENKTRVKTESCIFVYKGYDTLQLEPGTYTIWNPPLRASAIALTCRETATGAELESYRMDEIYSHIQGLRYDSPKG